MTTSNPNMTTDPAWGEPSEEAKRGLLRVFTFCGENEARPTYATELSATRAFILARQPPSLRSSVSLVVCPAKKPPLAPVEGLVVGIRIDTTGAERTGFEVAFTCIDEDQAGALERAAAGLPGTRRRPKAVPLPAKPTLPALHPSLRFPELHTVPRVIIDLPVG